MGIVSPADTMAGRRAMTNEPVLGYAGPVVPRLVHDWRASRTATPHARPPPDRLARPFASSGAAHGQQRTGAGVSPGRTPGRIRTDTGTLYNGLPLTIGLRGPNGSNGSRTAQPTVAASSVARVRTASSIGSVSLPVNVFCWLTW